MKSNYSQAFNEPANLIGISAFAALSIMLLNPIPFILGAALEAVYMLFVPDSALYASRLDIQRKKETTDNREALKQKVFQTTDSEFASHYRELEAVRSQLDDDYTARPDWRDVIDRLDTLLSKYLEFGLQDYRLRQYITTLSAQAEQELPGLLKPKTKENDELRSRLAQGQDAANNFSDETVRWVESKMSSIRLYFQSQINSIQQLVNEEEMRIAAGTGNQNNRDTLQKRIEIQNMMLKQAEKIGQGLVNLNQQMALMEETIRLINGQIKSKQPGQVLLDIENLVDQSETVSNFLQDIAPFEDETQRLLLSR
jgi:hypothetical protein